MLKLLVGFSVRDNAGEEHTVSLPLESLSTVTRQADGFVDGRGQRGEPKANRRADAHTDALVDLLRHAEGALDAWAEARLGTREPFLDVQAAEGIPPAATPEAHVETSSMGFVERLIVAVDSRIWDDAFDVNALAAAVGISRSTLSRRLQGAAGRAPMDFIWHRRLRWAAALLLVKEDSVAEIAYASGFKTAAHFSRRFLAFAGCSPSAYAARQQVSEGAEEPSPERADGSTGARGLGGEPDRHEIEPLGEV